jgi:hypothetical protein
MSQDDDDDTDKTTQGIGEILMLQISGVGQVDIKRFSRG